MRLASVPTRTKRIQPSALQLPNGYFSYTAPLIRVLSDPNAWSRACCNWPVTFLGGNLALCMTESQCSATHIRHTLFSRGKTLKGQKLSCVLVAIVDYV